MEKISDGRNIGNLFSLVMAAIKEQYINEDGDTVIEYQCGLVLIIPEEGLKMLQMTETTAPSTSSCNPLDPSL